MLNNPDTPEDPIEELAKLSSPTYRYPLPPTSNEPSNQLSYATFHLRPRLRIPTYVAGMLYFLAVIDAMFGAPLCFVTFMAVWNWSQLGRIDPFTLCMLFLGPMLLLSGCMMFWLTYQMERNQIVALRWLTRLIFTREILAWAYTVLIAVSMGKYISEAYPWLLFVVPATIASVTRFLLRRAAKRIPMWS